MHKRISVDHLKGNREIICVSPSLTSAFSVRCAAENRPEPLAAAHDSVPDRCSHIGLQLRFEDSHSPF